MPVPTIPAHTMRELICEALADGATVADVEYRLIDPAGLTTDEHDALWLYATARAERPHPVAVAVIGN